MRNKIFGRISAALHHRFATACLSMLVLASAALAALPSGFKPDKLAAMDTAITNAIAEKKLPGGVLWLERHGQVYCRAYGNRAVEPTVELMTADTIFDVASLTKVMATAPSIMLLVERGKIKLDEPVSTYLPEYKGRGRDTVTIRQLLTHTSGLPASFTKGPAPEGYPAGVRTAADEEPKPGAGAVFRYSDVNFILLGEVVRRVSGVGLDVFAAREIFKPLQMTETCYLPSASKLARIAPTSGSLRGKVHDPKARAMGGVAGHAGVFGTAADLARYARMMINEGELEGARVFKPETIKLMTSVNTPESIPARRGLGWDIESGYSRRGTVFPLGSYGHTGFTGTSMWIDPFSKTFLIFYSNRVHPDGRGNIMSLQTNLATLAAEAVEGFDFSNVPGALKPRVTNQVATVASTNVSAAVSNPGAVLNGIDVLVKNNFAPVRKLRLGLITNHTGHDRNRRPTIDLLKGAPEVLLVKLFSPEHGIRGQLDEKVGDGVDEKTGLPVYSLYGVRRAPTPEQLKDLDALVYDIQDIGCRFYTYISTLGLCLEAAGKAGIKFIVLDRINPINGLAVEGPVHKGASSFTAYHALPLRHGMTVGELARMYNAERGFKTELIVIPIEGWTRNMWFDQTGLPWTNPSPNMRSLTAATFYPGIGLHETAICVGRGTATPFELIGAPYINEVQLADELNRAGVAGVRFTPIRFTPTYSTFKDKPCAGVSLMLTGREQLPSVDLGIVLALTLQRLYPNDFALAKVNSLLQWPEAIEAIRAGKSLGEIKQDWSSEVESFKKRREPYLLYR